MLRTVRIVRPVLRTVRTVRPVLRTVRAPTLSFLKIGCFPLQNTFLLNSNKNRSKIHQLHDWHLVVTATSTMPTVDNSNRFEIPDDSCLRCAWRPSTYLFVAECCQKIYEKRLLGYHIATHTEFIFVTREMAWAGKICRLQWVEFDCIYWFAISGNELKVMPATGHLFQYSLHGIG